MDNNVNNNIDEGISLADLFKMFTRRIWLFLTITICGSILSLVFVLTMVKPNYKSNASLLVNPEKFQASTTNTDVSGALRATDTISSWIVDETIIKDALANLENDNIIEKGEYETKDIKSMISIKSQSSNLFIYVSCTSKNQDLSQDILNYVIKAGIDKSNELGEDSKPKYPVANNSYSVVTNATEGEKTDSKKKMYLMVGVLASLVVAAGVVIALELLKNKYSTLDEVKKSLNIPVIGHQFNDEQNINIEDINSNGFINKVNYEKLVTNIDFTVLDKTKNIVAFTSTAKGEGKSTTVFNVARTLANSNRKVLIVDLDLKMSSAHKFFKLEKEDGVAEYVSSNKEVTIKTINENISLITSGAKVPNPSIILQSEKLANLLENIKSNYDYVLLDCPPVMAGNDAKLVTKLTNEIVYVIGADKEKASIVRNCINEIDPSNIIGLNVTYLKQTKHDNYYYQYYKAE